MGISDRVPRRKIAQNLQESIAKLEDENAQLRRRAALADELWEFVGRAQALANELRWFGDEKWSAMARKWKADFEERMGNHLDGPCLNPKCQICHVERYLPGGDLYAA